MCARIYETRSHTVSQLAVGTWWYGDMFPGFSLIRRFTGPGASHLVCSMYLGGMISTCRPLFNLVGMFNTPTDPVRDPFIFNSSPSQLAPACLTYLVLINLLR